MAIGNACPNHHSLAIIASCAPLCCLACPRSRPRARALLRNASYSPACRPRSADTEAASCINTTPDLLPFPLRPAPASVQVLQAPGTCRHARARRQSGVAAARVPSLTGPISDYRSANATKSPPPTLHAILDYQSLKQPWQKLLQMGQPRPPLPQSGMAATIGSS